MMLLLLFITVFRGIARLFKMRGVKGGSGRADQESNWRLSIDLSTKCHFIFFFRGLKGAGLPTEGSSPQNKDSEI